MPELPDGTVLPHFVAAERTPHYDPGASFDNLRLRLGEVKEIVWPDDKRSRSKRYVEYRVYVEQRRNGTGFGRMYENCLLANPLAGLADQAVWTLRAAGPDRVKGSPTLGSKVLLLCVNGENASPVIIGGLRDPKDGKDQGTTSSPKHYARLAFNGVVFEVNDDGELIVTYGGKTKADGTTDVASDVAGAHVKLDKDGGITVSDGSGKNAVSISHHDGKVRVARENGFEVGAATDKMVLGTSYRDAEKQLYTQLRTELKQLQTLLQTAGTAITTAAAQPVPPGGVVGTLAPAGAALLAAAQVAGAMDQAYEGFEQAAAQKTDFLSDKDLLG